MNVAFKPYFDIWCWSIGFGFVPKRCVGHRVIDGEYVSVGVNTLIFMHLLPLSATLSVTWRAEQCGCPLGVRKR